MVMKVQRGSHLTNKSLSLHKSLFIMRFKAHKCVHPDSFNLFDDDFPGNGMNELEAISTLSPDPQEPQSNDVGQQDSGIHSSTTFSPPGTTPTEATGTCLTNCGSGSIENTSQFITIVVQ